MVHFVLCGNLYKQNMSGITSIGAATLQVISAHYIIMNVNETPKLKPELDVANCYLASNDSCFLD
jgi:hypothetical protein